MCPENRGQPTSAFFESTSSAAVSASALLAAHFPLELLDALTVLPGLRGRSLLRLG